MVGGLRLAAPADATESSRAGGIAAVDLRDRAGRVLLAGYRTAAPGAATGRLAGLPS
jgi:hypothetical protein